MTMLTNNIPTLFLTVLSISLVKCVILMGGTYWFFWKLFPENFFNYKIQQIPRSKPIVMTEFLYSMLSIIIQSIFLTFLFWGSQKEFFKLHWGIENSRIGTEILGFAIYFILYDSYFYWSHRWLHSTLLYKSVHSVHHRSLNPTPWSSYSFHPVECIINIFYMLPFVMLVPLSYESFFVLLVITDVASLAGHLGYEFLPRKTMISKVGGWLTTPTHHNMHHQYSKSNFGLYWNGWDKIFKTLHPRTVEEFQKIKQQSEKSN